MSFNGLLRQQLSVKNPTGTKDLHGKATLGSPVAYKCRFERTYKTIVSAERDKEPIHATAIVPSSANVSIGAQVTYDSDKYRVVQRDDAPGRAGTIHHYELYLQLWEFNQ